VASRGRRRARALEIVANMLVAASFSPERGV
jgi:hypothetical protein